LQTLAKSEIALSEMMRRRGLPAELRVELQDIYRPILLALIEAGMRGQSQPKTAAPGQVTPTDPEVPSGIGRRKYRRRTKLK
jgi:hypothetical protein